MQLKKYKLSDVAKTGSGGTPTSTRKEYYEGGTIPWINSGELSQPFIKQTNNYITELGYNSSSTKIYPKNDTVLLAMYGATAGKASLLQMDACTNQAICAIVPNKEIISPLFLKYKLDTIYSYLVGISTGSARDNLSQTGIANLSLSFPSIEEQNRIASMLYSFDQKISLNRAINQNLEALAKQLYDYWFIQFDFPDENGRPYKSSGGKMVWNERLKREIPERWENKCIKDFLRIFTGKKDVSKAIPGEYKFFSCAPEPITSNEYLYDGAAVLVSGNGSYTGRVNYYKGKFDLYQRTYACVIDNDYAISFFYYTLKNLFQPNFSGGKHGSSIPYIVLGDLADFQFAYNEKIVTKYLNKINGIFEMQFDNIKVIEDLTKQRDELLPLLMNGQVSVNSE